MSSTALQLAHSTATGSGPRSNRYDEGLPKTNARAADRTGNGANWADSINTSVVSSEISVSAPPITPAMATGCFASEMTHISAVSLYSLWLIATNDSPSVARRTMIFSPFNLLRSKACKGWPHSSMT